MDGKDTTQGNGTPNAAADGANTGGNADAGKTDEGKTTLTHEQHQAELDRIAAKTREEERKKADKATADAVAKALEEERRQAKLSEEEREKELQAKRQKEYEEREKNVTIRENKAAAIEKFAELKLPLKLVPFVVDVNLDVQNEKTSALQEAYNEAVKQGIAEATKGNPPKDVNAGNSQTNSKDDLLEGVFL